MKSKGKIAHKIMSIILIMFMAFSIITIIPAEKAEASTATTYQDKLINHALSHLGNRYNQFNDANAFNTEWCSLFITHTSLNAGLGDIIPTSGCGIVTDLAVNVVENKYGTITFVNWAEYNALKVKFKSNRIKYDTKYKPKKGDLILFGNYEYSGIYPFAHVGIVTANANNPYRNISTVEGNTNSNNYEESVVARKTRNDVRGFRIAAYVTPNYDLYNKTYAVNYNANGGTGAPSQQIKKHGVTLTLSSVKPTRSGYTFVAWGSSPTAKTAVNYPSGRYTGNAPYTYYAIWKQNATNKAPLPSAHFTWSEFKCECGKCKHGPEVMSAQLIQNLEKVREKFGKPVKITSGFRCQKYNDSLAGSIKNSKHTQGKAADIYIAGVTDTESGRRRVADYWMTLPGANYTYYYGTGGGRAVRSATYMGNAVHVDVYVGGITTTSTTNTNKTSTVKSATKPFTYQVRVTERDLRIRAGAGTGYASRGYIKPGVYTITETRTGSGSSAGWGKLSNGQGWIALDWAKRTASSYTVTVVDSDLRIRSGAGTGYANKGYIARGTYTITEVRAGTGSAKGWGRLSNGRGWIALDYAYLP